MGRSSGSSNIFPTFVPRIAAVRRLRTAPGMRERSPGVWELIVEAGRDPVTGRRRQVSRMFYGSLRDAKKARAALLTEVSKGKHTGTRATLDDLFDDWIVELKRKGRSPNTIHGYEKCYRRNIRPTLGRMAVTSVSTEDAHRSLRCSPGPWPGAPHGVPDPRLPLVDVHAGLPMGLARLEPRAVGGAAVIGRTRRRSCRPRLTEIRALIDAAEQSRRPEYAGRSSSPPPPACGAPSCAVCDAGAIWTGGRRRSPCRRASSRCRRRRSGRSRRRTGAAASSPSTRRHLRCFENRSR